MNLSKAKIKWIVDNFFWDEYGKYGPNGTLYYKGKAVTKPVEIVEDGDSWRAVI